VGVGNWLIRGFSKLFGRAGAKEAEGIFTRTTIKEVFIDSDGTIRGARASQKFVEEVGKGAKAAGTKVVTASRAAYAILATGVVYLLYRGFPQILHDITGLPIWVCQIIIAAVLIFVILNVIRTVIYRVKRTVVPYSGGYRRRY